MKVNINLKPVHKGSKGRGVGVYTKGLANYLKEGYPADTYILSSKKEAGVTCDLIHYPYFDPFFLTLPLTHAKPFVVTIHDLIPLVFKSHFKAGLKGNLKWLVQSMAVKRASAIITDSECSKRDIMNILHYPESQIHVIPLGPTIINEKQSSSDAVKSKYNLPDRFLLYVGDINWNKNVVGLINAFARLADPTLHLVLVGKSLSVSSRIPEYKAIEKSIQSSGKSSSIHRLGYVPDTELRAIYQNATLYVQPSWYEGFGLPLLDAMQWGCPIASSSLGSLPEVGGDAVLYFDPHHDGEMVSTIENLLQNQQLRENMVKKGNERVKLFKWKKTAVLTHNVYEKVLA